MMTMVPGCKPSNHGAVDQVVKYAWQELCPFIQAYPKLAERLTVKSNPY